MLGAALTTAATRHPTRASALTRAMSTGSMTAGSPGRRRSAGVVWRGVAAGPQWLRAVFRARVEPTGAGHSRPRLLCPSAPKGADAHAPHAVTAVMPPVLPTRACDLSVTHRMRHHGGCDTPGAAHPAAQQDRYRFVINVTAVTGVARARTSAVALPRGAAPPPPPAAQ